MSSLAGHLLIAMPQMDDPYFVRSVVYLCSHSEDDGAMGIIVNKAIEGLTIDELCTRLQLEPAAHSSGSHPVHFGGPVQSDRGLLLHSADYRKDGTVSVGDDFALTGTLDALRAMAEGCGPRQSIFALGYAGWGPGQLESEIRANGWLSVAADTNLVFETGNAAKWQRALAKLGVNPEALSGLAGHA